MTREQQIDRMVKSLATTQSRRGMLRLFGGMALSAGLVLIGRDESAAKRRRRRGRRGPGTQPQPAPKPQPTNQCQTNAQCSGLTPFCNLNGVCDAYPDRIDDNDYVAWRGIWTRRGTSNVYDVTWHHYDNRQVSRAVKTVVIEGNAFSTLPEGTCNYKGTFSDERKMVRGSKVCSGPGVDRPWDGELS